MKIKRTVCALALMLCLGVSALMLTACGKNEVTSLFGKTLSFYGYANISEYDYTIENKTMKLDTLVKNYFDKIDWQKTLGKSKEEVQNATNALTLMSKHIYKDVKNNEDALRTIEFKFSSAETSKVTVLGKDYAVESLSLYEYRFKTGIGDEEITIRYEGDNTFIYLSNNLLNSALPVSETNSISIEFLQPIEIVDGQTGGLSVSGRVLYKV